MKTKIRIEDFATYSGKAIFDCGLVKAIIHLDMVNNRIDMDVRRSVS